MEKFFKWLYYYSLVLFVIWMLYMCFALVMATRKDALKRGFIPCTENLVLQLADCQRGNIVCPLKHLWQNTKCNTLVVLDGFGAWVKGKQPRPWSNYLFEPVPDEISAENRQQADNLKDEINTLKKHYKLLQAQEIEVEAKAAKEYQLNENVLADSPENDKATLNGDIVSESDILQEENLGDIRDEVFIDVVSANGRQKETLHSQDVEDTLKMLQKFTEEKLQKGSVSNEK